MILDSNGAAASDAADAIGSSARAITMNVAAPTAVEEMFDGIGNRYGRIDVLFNNAGSNRRGASMELSLEDWNAVIAVNMTGMLLCTRAAAEHMTMGGSIVSTAFVPGMTAVGIPTLPIRPAREPS
ncbi:NAD(P)-dependent dehydrogenase (short-subunit alcohol dehydrogenase family) [Paraburkholderia sp. GAS334]